VNDLYRLAYSTPLSAMTLLDIHRSITYLQRRQLKVAWLAHRARRVTVLRRAREQRLQVIAARRAAQ
jgi:hypothetical protein